MRGKHEWIPADPLGEALHALRMSGTFYCRSEFTEPWGLTMPPMEGCLSFHVLTSGRCWLEVEGAEDVVLRPGDLVLLPRGEGHRLLGEPGAPAPDLFDLPEELISERYSILRHGGGGAMTRIICGAVRFEHPAARHLMKLLPQLIYVEGTEGMQSTLRLMAEEAKELRPGGDAVITRLADILIIQAIRAWLERDRSARTGWLGALQDRQIGPALTLIHRQPARCWTVAELAREVAMSRSAFSARFTETVGEPPMHYVARWRMQVAHTWLTDERAGVAEIAERLGYESEAAFRRAFKRYTGMTPGAVRARG